MNLDSFDRGEDIYRSATLMIDNVAADTSDFTTIAVEVRHKFSKVVIGSYTLAGGTVQTPAPTSAGIITFIVARSDNESAQTGIYEYEITTTETDADYEDSIRYRKFIGDCFKLNP